MITPQLYNITVVNTQRVIIEEFVAYFTNNSAAEIFCQKMTITDEIYMYNAVIA